MNGYTVKTHAQVRNQAILGWFVIAACVAGGFVLGRKTK